MYYPQFPESNGWAITTYFLEEEYKKQFGEDHYAIDMAYQNKHFSGVRYIYAVADGVIAAVQKSDGKTANAIRIEHEDIIPDKLVNTRYYHLASIADGIKKGKKVKKGEIIGVEGKTGYATGSHLHFEFWICPKGYKFNYRDVAKYAVDPLKYLYLHEGQACVHDPLGLVQTLPEMETTKLPEGSTFECLKSNGLNYRTSPEIVSSNRCGLLPAGTYEAIETYVDSEYTWVHFIKDGKEYWATIYEGLSVLHLPMDKDEKIAYLEAENAKLKAEIESLTIEKDALDLECDRLNKECNDLSGENDDLIDKINRIRDITNE
jgi:hypothetical protein